MEVNKENRGGGQGRGEVCNSLLSPSPVLSPNLPRTINWIRRQTLIEDYHATGSTIYVHAHTHAQTQTHSEGEGGLACNRIYSSTHPHTHTHTFMLTRVKKFAAHICSLCTDFYQADCIVHQSHCVSVGLRWEVRARETQQALGEQKHSERAGG